MAGRAQPTELPRSTRAAVARRMRDCSAASLLIAGPISAALLALLLLTSCLLRRAATSWIST
eukprot:9914712-Alexandrium_andersonii.AAC.1